MLSPLFHRRWLTIGAVALCAAPWTLGSTALAQSSGDATGLVEFDHPGAGAPIVEVDLPADSVRDLVGLGDAALAGVAEALLKSQAAQGAGAEDVKLATEHVAKIRELVQTVQGAVREVRVRVYRPQAVSPGESAAAKPDIAQHYVEKLRDTSWDRVVRVNDQGKSVAVFMHRDSGAIRGVLAIADGGNELAMVNVVCDVSPDRVKQVVEQAVAMGLQFGGEQHLQEILRELKATQQR